MNLWRKKKTYVWPACRASYLHDKGYLHASFACPKRPVVTGRLVKA